MRARPVLLAVLLLVCLAAWLLPQPAEAIPAFARRHRVSCTTCHAPFPRLKPYGEEFAGNGMIMPEDEKERYYVTAGDDLLWLNKDFPLAVRFDAYGVWNEEADAETDLQLPWGLKLLSGGAVAKGISYYFYFYMSERGEVAGIEDAYLHFDDVFGSGIDIMAGQFQTSDPLMKRELRLTYEDYEIYTTRVDGSLTNLTYDRGLMVTYGIASTGTDLVGMVVNGNGKEPADANHEFDNDKFKNVGFRLLQGLGQHVSVGGFVYYGKERLAWPEASDVFTNEVLYYGPDVGLSAGPASLTVQYLRREDDPDVAVEWTTDGIVAELILAPQGDDGRHWLTLLYNRVDVERELGAGAPAELPPVAGDYETYTASVSYLLRRNVRGVVEYTYDAEQEASRATIGVVSAF